jgi:hypothetical protein
MSKEMNTELSAIQTLLGEGMVFKAGRLKLHLKQSYLGTLLHLSKIYSLISLDEAKLKDSAFAGSYMLVPENAKRVALLIAIAVLNSKWKIKFFSKPLANYLLWVITPEKLFQIMGLVLVVNNTASFTNSIRLIHTLRLMKPKENLIEGTED